MCLCFFSALSAQNNLNAYKYVIVPKKFDFQKSGDQYQLNQLTKFLFNKEGFNAIWEDEKLPEDLYNNPCLGLKANVLENSSMFATKLKIELSDCRNATIFNSNEGKSKIKEFKKGHHDALRKAFESVKEANYRYNSNLSESIKREDAIVETVEVKEEPIIEEKTEKIIEDKPNKVIENVANNSQKKLDANLEQVALVEVTTDSKNNILYAQQIDNGFQLVDSTPQKVFVALKSSTQDLFYLKNKAGILYKEGAKWYAEYYKDNKLIKEELTIKF